MHGRRFVSQIRERTVHEGVHSDRVLKRFPPACHRGLGNITRKIRSERELLKMSFVILACIDVFCERQIEGWMHFFALNGFVMERHGELCCLCCELQDGVLGRGR